MIGIHINVGEMLDDFCYMGEIMKRVIRTIIKLYKILTCLWLIILLISVIATYVCIYDIVFLENIFLPFYCMSRYNINITLVIILIGILFLFFYTKLVSKNFKEIGIVFFPNILFIFYVIWYLYNI